MGIAAFGSINYQTQNDIKKEKWNKGKRDENKKKCKTNLNLFLV